MAGDKKDAANIAVGLSSQLINASLTLIALSGAFFTFILDKKEPTAFFYVTYVLTFLFLIASIILGGTGIAKVKKDGEGGRWQTTGSPDWFDLQSFALLLGILFIFLLPFTGVRKIEKAVDQVSGKQPINKTDSLLVENLKLLQSNQRNIDSTLRVITKKLQTKPVRRTSVRRKCKC